MRDQFNSTMTEVVHLDQCSVAQVLYQFIKSFFSFFISFFRSFFRKEIVLIAKRSRTVTGPLHSNTETSREKFSVIVSGDLV